MIYQRLKKGKGFCYIDNKGLHVSDPELKDRFKALVIPPAWEQVTINSSPRAKIQATGYDIKGRKQYIYNPKYRKQQDELKFDRIIRFAKQLEHMRRVTGQHLRKRKLGKEKVLATMVRLLEAAFFRPGNEYYRKANQSFGLTTLRSKHLEIRGDEMIFTFRGKSGQDQEKHVMDARLTKIVQELDDLPGYEIFKYIDDEDNIHDIRSNDLNQYIREVMGDEFSAKDFRTWAGTVIAAMALDEIGAVEPEDQKRLKKNIKDAVVMVSEKLGNTPAIARNSYIDPRVITHYTQGRTLANMNRSVKRLLKTNEQLSVEELGVLCLLRKRLNKQS